ncbi:MAG: redoxin domain-containing protein [Solirubrobacterales bacterium]
MKVWGTVIVSLIAIAVVFSLFLLLTGSRPVGSENLIGRSLPDFAAPLADSGLRLDSNVFTPEAARAGDSTAACDVRVPGAFNSCRDLTGRSIVAFWNPDKPKCIEQVDELDALAREAKDVSAVAVSFDKPIDEVAPVTADHRWRISVAVDRDGAVSALYSVAGCPTVFFAVNGKIVGVRLGLQSSAELRRGLSDGDG